MGVILMQEEERMQLIFEHHMSELYESILYGNFSIHYLTSQCVTGLECADKEENSDMEGYFTRFSTAKREAAALIPVLHKSQLRGTAW